MSEGREIAGSSQDRQERPSSRDFRATREAAERPRCDLCLYFKPRGNRCRRHPPVVYYDINELKPVSAYPTVNPDMWCGEFVDWAIAFADGDHEEPHAGNSGNTPKSRPGHGEEGR